VIGGSASDTLIGSNSTWHITDNNAGDIDGAGVFDFESMENLTGSASDETFVFSEGKSVSGVIDGGGGYDTLDYSAYTTSLTLNRQTLAASSTGGYANIEQFVAGRAADTLVGSNAANTWHITGANAGDIGGAGVFDFSGVENLTGGTDTDAFVFSDGAGVSGTVAASAGSDTLDYSAYASAVTVNRLLLTATGTGGYRGIEVVAGGSASDTLVSANAANTWNLTAANAGNIGGAGVFAFSAIENLTGGTSADTFVFGDGVAMSGTVDGSAGIDTLNYTAYVTPVTVNRQALSATGTGGYVSVESVVGGSASDTLTGPNVASTWNLTANNAGNVGAAFTFNGIENLSGGSAADTFVFADGVGVAGTIDGSTGYDTLDYTAYTTAVTVDRQAGTATGTGGYANVEHVVGGSASDTLIGRNSTWHITDNNAGDIDGAGVFDFESMENLRGTGSDDTFVLSDGKSVSGSVDGAGGHDTLDYSAYTTPVTLNREMLTASGTAGYASIEAFVGGSASDTLVGGNVANTWDVTGSNAGNIGGAGVFDFSGVENLTGGTDADAFVLSDAAGVSGNVAGSAGSDTLDYGAYTTPVTVNRQALSATGTGGYRGIEIVVGGSASDTLVGANAANTWNLTAANAGNIGGAGVFAFSAIENLTGGTAADTFVFGNGVAISGAVDGATGYDTLDYAAYATSVTMNRETGSATGTNGYASIEQFVGGAASDTLVGANAASTWNVTANNAGNIGGAGVFDFSSAENLTGGAGADTFVFGDGMAIDGALAAQAGHDALDLSAYTSDAMVDITAAGAGDVNGAFTFASLETVTTGSGDDSFVFSDGASLAGTIVAGAGYDTLDYSAYTSAVTVNRQTGSATGTGGYSSIEQVLGGTASDTLVGSNSTWHITDDNAGDIDGAGTFDFTGIENLTGSAADDTFIFTDGKGVAGTVDGGAGTDMLDYSAYTSAIAVSRQALSATGTGGYVSIESVVGGGASDVLTGANAANTWNVTVDGAGNIGGTFAFSAMENLIGGSAADTFVFADGMGVTGTVTGSDGYDTLSYAAYTTAVSMDREALTATATGGYASIEHVIGGSGSDTLRGANVANTWHVTVNNAGDIGGAGVFDFQSMENLTGSASDDTFIFGDGRGVAGAIDGSGGYNTLDYRAYTTNVTLNLQTQAATGTGGSANVDLLMGGSGSDALVAADAVNTWHITANNAGDINGAFDFQGVERVHGGADADTFVFTAGALVDEEVHGHGGNDKADLSAFATANTWNVTTDNGGTVDVAGETFGFHSVEELVGGDGTDSFIFADGQILSFGFDGNAGEDTADFSDYSAATIWTLDTADSGHVDTLRGSFDFASVENFIGHQVVPTFDFVDLQGEFDSVVLADVVVPGDRGIAWLVITNAGNTPVTGWIDIDVYASADQVLSTVADTRLGSVQGTLLDLPAGEFGRYAVPIAVPSDLAAGAYFLLGDIDVQDAVAEQNELNNVAATDTQVNVAWQFGTFGGRARVPLTVQDASGEQVTFSLWGPGSGQVVGGATFDEVVLDGTTSRSVLYVRTGSDVGTSVNDITVHGVIGRVNATATDVRGDITVDGAGGATNRGVTRWYLRDVADGSRIRLAGDRGDQLVFEARNVGHAELDFTGVLRWLEVASWTDGEIKADEAWQLRITDGDLGADVVMTGSVAVSVTQAHVAGDITGGVWNVPGDISTVWVGGGITGDLIMSDDVTYLDVSGAVTGGLTIFGDAHHLVMRGDVDGSLDVRGDLHAIDLHQGTLAGGTVDVSGDLGQWVRVRRNGRRRWAAQGLWSGRDLGAAVTVGGSVCIIDVDGQARGAFTIGGDADRIVLDQGTTADGDVTVIGNLSSFEAGGGTFAGDLKVGSIGRAYITSTSGLEGKIEVTMNDMTGDGDTDDEDDTTGDVSLLHIQNGTAAGGSIDIEGDLGYQYRRRRNGRRRWYAAGFWSGDDVAGAMTIGGTAWMVDIDGQLRAALTIGVDANTIVLDQGTSADGDIAVTGNLVNLQAAGDSFAGDLKAGSIGRAHITSTNGLQGNIEVTKNDMTGDGDTDDEEDSTGSVDRLHVDHGTGAGGTIDVEGDLGRLFSYRRRGRRRWAAEGLWCGADVGAAIDVGGTAWQVDIDGQLKAGLTIGVDANTIALDQGTSADGDIAITGNLANLQAGGDTFAGDLRAGSIDRAYINSTNGLEGKIEVTKNDMTGDGDTDDEEDTSGNVSRLHVQNGTAAGATIDVAGDLGRRYSYRRRGRRRWAIEGLWSGTDVRGNVTVGDTAWLIDVTGDLVDASIAADEIDSVRVDGTIRSTNPEQIRALLVGTTFYVSDSTWAGYIGDGATYVFDGTVTAQIG